MSRRTAGGATAAMMAALVVAASLLAFAPRASAQDAKPGDAQAIEAISMTRLAYVITGDPAINSISRAGLEGLSQFLIEKTALEPGDPAGIDLEKDELSFYPIIYWPVDPGAAMPSEAAIAHLDEYMKEGGTVLFDTRDQFATGLDAGRRKPGDRAAARHPRPSQRAAAGAGAGRPRADQILLHPSRVSRPLQRQPALGGSLARCREHRQPPGPHAATA